MDLKDFVSYQCDQEYVPDNFENMESTSVNSFNNVYNVQMQRDHFQNMFLHHYGPPRSVLVNTSEHRNIRNSTNTQRIPPVTQPFNNSPNVAASTSSYFENLWNCSHVKQRHPTDPDLTDQQLNGHQQLESLNLNLSSPLNMEHNRVTVSPTISSGDSLATNNFVTSDNIINDDLLRSLSLKEFNERLRGYTSEEADILKYRRRILKRREYSVIARRKRNERFRKLECTNLNLRLEIHRLHHELSNLRKERDRLTSQNRQLVRRLAGSHQSRKERSRYT